MTLTSIDAVINDQRLNGNKAEVAKAMQLLKRSEEFFRLVNVSTAVGLNHLGINPITNVKPMLEFVENIMALAMDVGYRIHEQEISSRELEVFFGKDEAEKSQGEEVPRVCGGCE